jgi:hypothetical protein
MQITEITKATISMVTVPKVTQGVVPSASRTLVNVACASRAAAAFAICSSG